MIYNIAIFVSFFLALLVFTKKGRSIADIILGIWLITIGFHCALFYFSYFGNLNQFPHLIALGFPFPFLHGPLLYLYTFALTNPEKLPNKKWTYHFMLPLLVIVIFTPFYVLYANEKVIVFQNRGKGYETELKLFDTLLTISGILYVIFTYLLLEKHKKRILNQFSNQEKINLDWLRFLFYGMSVLWFIIIFIGGDENIFPVATIFIFFIGYFGIKQAGIFSNKQLEEIKIIDEPLIDEQNLEKKKYAKSGLNEDSIKELHQKLVDLMQTEKPFLNPELTLSDLSNKLDTHPNYLSQVINDVEGIPFYDYVNTFRIEEFKRLCANNENQKYTLLALAYDCGFNSKTSFNRNFRKTMNQSPTEYLKQVDIVLE
jgi:AraC-like DNA-binding protein